MPSQTNARSIRIPVVILTGVAAFSIGLFAMLSGAAEPRAHAQTDCSQSNDPNCGTTAITTDCTQSDDPNCGMSPITTDQSACTQPNDPGCPMSLNSTVQAALSDASTMHRWQLDVNDSSNFSVSLTALPADYQLAVNGPDGKLLGASNNIGTADEVVQVTNAGFGTYTISIDSPSGQASDQPYTLVAATTDLTAAVPLNSYDAPTRTSGYR